MKQPVKWLIYNNKIQPKESLLCGQGAGVISGPCHPGLPSPNGAMLEVHLAAHPVHSTHSTMPLWVQQVIVMMAPIGWKKSAQCHGHRGGEWAKAGAGLSGIAH
jgi:hypothetical protein